MLSLFYYKIFINTISSFTVKRIIYTNDSNNNEAKLQPCEHQYIYRKPSTRNIYEPDIESVSTTTRNTGKERLTSTRNARSLASDMEQSQAN